MSASSMDDAVPAGLFTVLLRLPAGDCAPPGAKGGGELPVPVAACPLFIDDEG